MFMMVSALREFEAEGDPNEPLTRGEFNEFIQILAKTFEQVATKEDVRGLDGRIDSLEERIDRVETRLDAVETRLGAVETRLDAVETRLDAVETRLVSIEDRLDKVESIQQEILGILKSIDTKLAPIVAINNLPERIIQLEDDVHTLKQKVGM